MIPPVICKKDKTYAPDICDPCETLDARVTALEEEVQHKMTPGENIVISPDNVISAVDEKLAISSASANTAYNVILGTGATTQTRQYDNGLSYNYTMAGQIGQNRRGESTLIVGNNRDASTPGNRKGGIKIYGIQEYGTTLVSNPASHDDITVTLPASAGTLALTSDVPDVTVTPLLGTGQRIATIDVAGNSTDLYAPSGGGSTAVKNVWYGTCSNNSTPRMVSTLTGDFTYTAGNTVFVKMTYANTNNTLNLNVDGQGQATAGPGKPSFAAGDLVGFVYDGTQFVMIDNGIASTTEYGRTMLSSATNSTSTTVAATPSAVKAAYDLASSKSVVSVNPVYASGHDLGTITIDSTTTHLYMPTGGFIEYFFAYTTETSSIAWKYDVYDANIASYDITYLSRPRFYLCNDSSSSTYYTAIPKVTIYKDRDFVRYVLTLEYANTVGYKLVAVTPWNVQGSWSITM